MKRVKSFLRFLVWLAVVLIVVSIVQCEDETTDIQYKYTIENVQDSVCVKAEPDTAALRLCSLPAGTVLQDAKENKGWYEVWTSDSIHGFVDKKAVKKESATPVAIKGDLKELEEAGQDIAVGIIKFSPGWQKEDCPLWMGVVTLTILMVCVVMFLLRLWTKVRYSIYYDYAVTVLNALVITFTMLNYNINLRGCEVWMVVTFAAALPLFTLLLWAYFVKTASRLLHGLPLVEKHVVFNIRALIVVIAFAYSFEEATDIAIIGTVAVNLYFLLKYMLKAAKHHFFMDFLKAVVLALVCFFPYLVLTVLSIKIGFYILVVVTFITIIVLFIVGIFAARAAGVEVEEKPKSDITYKLYDAEGKYVDEVDEDGRSVVSGITYTDFEKYYYQK